MKYIEIHPDSLLYKTLVEWRVEVGAGSFGINYKIAIDENGFVNFTNQFGSPYATWNDIHINSILPRKSEKFSNTPVLPLNENEVSPEDIQLIKEMIARLDERTDAFGPSSFAYDSRDYQVDRTLSYSITELLKTLEK